MAYNPLLNPHPVSGTVTANAGTGTMAVSGTFWQATQPVSGTVTANAGTGTFAVSGPLTDTQLRATAVPVSLASTTVTGSVAVTGTFWQATQPVSLASTTITGSVAVTGPLTDTQLRATAVPVSLTSTTITGSVAVTGTFWQTTQPVSIAATVAVSGPLTDTQLRATAVPVSLTSTTITGSVAVTGTFWQATQPVSGTFFQATQPVSIAGNQAVNNVQVGGVAVAVGNGVSGTGVQRVAIASDQTPFPAKDATSVGRVVRNFILDAFTAAPVADAMQSVVQWYNNAAVVATVSPAVVPAGKILRLTGGRIETKSLATVGSVVMRVRINTAGTAVIGSPIAASAACGSRAGATTVAMTGGHDHAEFTFGDEGLEIPAAAGVGFSLAGYGPTGTLTLQGVTRFEVWGYEYTA